MYVCSLKSYVLSENAQFASSSKRSNTVFSLLVYMFYKKTIGMHHFSLVGVANQHVQV